MSHAYSQYTVDVSTMRHMLVIDLEATCDDKGTVPSHEMEIIEIGAVMVDLVDLQPVSEFQSFIRPTKHPKLTAFCTSLTSIRQKDVDAAPLFIDVYKDLLRWSSAYQYAAPEKSPSDTASIDENTGENQGGLCWGSWGDYDRKQFLLDCARHQTRFSLPNHVNIKRLFSSRYNQSRGYGMAGALAKVGIPLVGTHHRGIDDARNIAKLLPWALGRV